MRITLIFLLILLSLACAGNKKIVIDLTTDDMATFEGRFRKGVPGTIRYLQAQGDDVDAVVVIHGGAYKFFVANLGNTRYDDDKLLEAAQERLRTALKKMLADYPVKLEVCRVGLISRAILSDDLYPFVTPIPSAMIGLVTWQNKGYAYIPIP